ncbi:MAG: hypothetical protein M1834_000378 [Cirrosporium novae-zelandiae]|nr:MAG: hypothetical protein M1834_000378 [Cirrosporium novae-zelandiae]
MKHPPLSSSLSLPLLLSFTLILILPTLVPLVPASLKDDFNLYSDYSCETEIHDQVILQTSGECWDSGVVAHSVSTYWDGASCYVFGYPNANCSGRGFNVSNQAVMVLGNTGGVCVSSYQGNETCEGLPYYYRSFMLENCNW